MRVAIGVMIWAGLAGAAMAQPPAQRPRLYTVARIGSAIDDAQTVGAKRAGMMCLPNGVIHWGDVFSGTQMDQREVVQDVVEDAGLTVTPLGNAPDRAFRLRGTVRTAAFDLCARAWLGNARALSGTVTLGIEWRLEDPTGGPVVSHVSTITRTIAGRQAAPLGAIYRTTLAEAARDAAAWLKAN